MYYVYLIMLYQEIGKNWEVIQSEDDGDDRVSTASSLNESVPAVIITLNNFAYWYDYKCWK